MNRVVFVTMCLVFIHFLSGDVALVASETRVSLVEFDDRSHNDVLDRNLQIETDDLPDTIYLNQPFDYYFHATGGIEPYYWQKLGGDLPFGLTFDGDTLGRLHGTPSWLQTYFFSIACEDSDTPPGKDTVFVEMTVEVYVGPPIASFSFEPDSGLAPLTVSFTDESDGIPTSWKWYFDDGDSSEVQNPQHDYDTAGVYFPVLHVSNENGSDSVTSDLPVVVIADPPVADFSFDSDSGFVPLTVNFTDNSSNYPSSWKWHFGDGDSSDIQNPQHEYTAAGEYYPQLVVSNAYGTDSMTSSIPIIVIQPWSDVGVSTILSPPDSIYIGESYPLKSEITNYGNSTETFLVAFFAYMEGSSVPVASDSLEVSAMPPASVDTVTFNKSLEPDVDTTYVLTSYTLLVSDEDISNDTTTSASESFDVGGIGGYVYNAAAKPIEGVYVEAVGTSVCDSSASYGAYYLTGLAPGTYDVSFSHPNYRDTTVIEVTVTSNDSTGLDLVMESAAGDVGVSAILSPPDSVQVGHNYSFYSEITNYGNNPQSFDVVFIVAILDSTPPVVVDTVSVSVMLEGAIDTVIFGKSFDVLLDTLYTLVSYTVLESDLDTSNDTTTLVSDAYQMGDIAGTVRDTAANPIEGVYVLAVSTSVDDTTDSNGEYYLGGLFPSVYNVSFSHPYYIDSTVTGVSVSSGDTTELNVVLQKSYLPPEISPIGPHAFIVSFYDSIQVSATDPNGTTPMIFAEDLPGDATFPDTAYGSGLFEWIPDSSDVGLHTVLFIASDSVLADSEYVDITVTVINHTPPLGYWNFDEESGDTAYDLSGYGNNGTIYGNPNWVTGKSGTALDLDGQDDYILVGDVADLDITGNLTIVLWFKTNAVQRGTLVNKLDNADPDNGYWLGMDDGYFQPAETMSFKLANNSSGGMNNYSSFLTNLTFTDGDWHFLAGVFEINHYPKIYIDGDEQAGTNIGQVFQSIGSASSLSENLCFDFIKLI